MFPADLGLEDNLTITALRKSYFEKSTFFETTFVFIVNYPFVFHLELEQTL